MAAKLQDVQNPAVICRQAKSEAIRVLLAHPVGALRCTVKGGVLHGATGVSQWTPLADMYTSQRTLRLADGPDEVHWFVVGRAELSRWVEEGASEYDPKASYLARQPAGAAFRGP